MLCALEDKKPCPTFRPAHPDGLRPPRQLSFVFRQGRRHRPVRVRARAPSALSRASRSCGTGAAIQRLPTVSVRPWARIDARITNDAASNKSSLCGTAEFSTSSENSIEATPFGPNQAMKSFVRLRQARAGQ